MRRIGATRIIATLGPASSSLETIESLAESSLDNSFLPIRALGPKYQSLLQDPALARCMALYGKTNLSASSVSAETIYNAYANSVNILQTDFLAPRVLLASELEDIMAQTTRDVAAQQKT